MVYARGYLKITREFFYFTTLSLYATFLAVTHEWNSSMAPDLIHAFILR